MSKPYLSEENRMLQEALQAYSLPQHFLGAVRYGRGHINDTFCLVSQGQDGDPVRFILQRLSGTAFPHPEQVMENMVRITAHLRKKLIMTGGDPERQTLNLVKTADGKDFYVDSSGGYWRLTNYVEGTICHQSATPELFEASARTFGNFQRLLQDFPAETLYETIPHFHDTKDRLKKFLAVLEADPMGRAADTQEEIRFVLDRQADCAVAMDALQEGRLPLRVTHNDTKLNNILMDKETGEGVCVIDLDTTMPGLSIFDFGDSIRFGANHSVEDEPDLSKVNFDIALFAAYTRGFLEGCAGALTREEIRYLPWGARLMTLECGIRFLTDYLDGDHYFRAKYPEHNLRRCRTQFKLVRDMEQQFEEMKAIVAQYL